MKVFQFLLFLSVLFAFNLQLTLARLEFNKISDRFNSFLEPWKQRKVLQKIDIHENAILHKVDRLTDVVEKLVNGMTAFEQRMTKMESSVEVMQQKLDNSIEATKPKNHDKRSEPQKVDLSEMERILRENFEKTNDRFDQMEQSLGSLEGQLHLLQSQSSDQFAQSSQCIDRKYFTAVLNETNAICRESAVSAHLLPASFPTDDPSPVSSSDPSNSVLHFQMTNLNVKMAKISELISAISFEFNGGKIDTIERTVLEDKVVLREVLDELEIKNDQIKNDQNRKTLKNFPFVTEDSEANDMF